MTNREKRENRWGILFSLPCILGFLIFALLPMAVSLGLSFTNFNFTTGGQFIGISNYKNLFSGSDPYFYKSLLVTVIYVALSVPTAIIFSFFIAMLLNTNVKGKGFFRTIFYLPTVVPIVAMAAIWMWILEAFKKRKYQYMAKDREGRDVFLADSGYVLQMAQMDFKHIKFHFTSEF